MRRIIFRLEHIMMQQLIPSYDENGWTGGLQGWDWVYGINTGDEDRNEAIRGWLKKMGSYEVQCEVCTGDRTFYVA